MKFGAFFLLQSPKMDSIKTVYENAFEQMKLAEDLGFDSIWLAEHHFSNYGFCPNPLLLAIKVAQITKRVRIGTAVLVLPLWHPIRLAEDIAMTDLLTDGRLELGIGRGYQVHEFDAFGTDMDQSRHNYEEFVEILMQSFKTESFSYNGGIYKFPELATYPKVIQKPHPQIWVAAQSDESIKNAASRGFSLFTSGSGRSYDFLTNVGKIFRQAADDSGNDSSQMEFSVQNQVYVTENENDASESSEHHRWQYRMANHLRNGTLNIENGVARVEVVTDEPELEDFTKTRTLSGTPDKVSTQIKHYRDEVGITQLNCSFSFGTLGHDKIKKSMKLFAEKVMPQFH
jgi:alkanesulfonate monooxygenase SsuD/methylene tetrahydromethanopterin reductase-like flavin-dependent oxidoreductase (luciferase family)